MCSFVKQAPGGKNREMKTNEILSSLSVITKTIKISAGRLSSTAGTSSLVIHISLFKADGQTFLVVNLVETPLNFAPKKRILRMKSLDG